jgi:F-type H+-transporting ATPase subunit b
MELYPSDLLIHIINIVVLFILLRLILFKPVSRFLSARSERIKNQLDDAKNRLEEADSMKREYKRQLESATEQGHEIIRGSQTKASQEAKAIIADAHAQADILINEAHEKIAKEQAQAMEQMRVEVAQLATDIAARILKREVTAEDNKAIAEEFFREMRTK